ncbi:hypothetical protein NPIL_180141 [Nephila pilipes]|uniref:Uncharacterized protein n=1 Tax=Nephila pilipes TaxID=299642 RepID=A0A8X6T658_NEPPI|nr:hypothetical protein NPIL_180141 [Nephila pilipes]
MAAVDYFRALLPSPEPVWQLTACLLLQTSAGGASGPRTSIGHHRPSWIWLILQTTLEKQKKQRTKKKSEHHKVLKKRNAYIRIVQASCSMISGIRYSTHDVVQLGLRGLCL